MCRVGEFMTDTAVIAGIPAPPLVVLTVRNPERWYDSIRATIFTLRDDQWPEGPRDIIFTRTFGGRLTDRAHCQAVFTQHVAAVREAIAPDRLLVFDVKEGWE